MPLEDSVNKIIPGSSFQDYGAETNFWNNAYSWEPKKQHQFVMEIDGIPSYLVKASAKPTITNGEVTLDHINVQRYVKGKSMWNQYNIV